MALSLSLKKKNWKHLKFSRKNLISFLTIEFLVLEKNFISQNSYFKTKVSDYIKFLTHTKKRVLKLKIWCLKLGKILFFHFWSLCMLDLIISQSLDAKNPSFLDECFYNFKASKCIKYYLVKLAFHVNALLSIQDNFFVIKTICFSLERKLILLLQDLEQIKGKKILI